MPKRKKNSRKGTAVKRCLHKSKRSSSASGCLKLRSITMDRIRGEMNDFYEDATIAEGLFLLDALMMASTRRSRNRDSCAIGETTLWCVTGSGLPDLE